MFALNIRLLDFWFSVLQKFRTCSFFFCALCCLFFFDIQILITPLVSVGHCVVCSSLIYGFRLPQLVSSNSSSWKLNLIL